MIGIVAICQTVARRSSIYISIPLTLSKAGAGSLPLLRFFNSGSAGEPQSLLHPLLYDLLVNKYHFSPNSASQVASVVPRRWKPEKSDSVLAFLKETGFASPELEKLVTSSPRLISVNLEKFIKPKIRVFLEFGISSGDAVEIITRHPKLLRHSANKLRQSFSTLKTFVGLDQSIELTRFLKATGWFVRYTADGSWVRNVELLKNYVSSVDQIRWLMHRYPKHLLRSPEYVKEIVNRVVVFGIHKSSNKFIRAFTVLSSLSDKTLQLKKRTFWEMGFSDDDIAAAFRCNPSLFGMSESKMKNTKALLLASGKYNTSCIVHFPLSLAYSIENRHKPRLRVLKLLEDKNLIQRWPCLSKFCSMSNKNFYKKYVAPFQDKIGDVYTVKSVATH